MSDTQPPMEPTEILPPPAGAAAAAAAAEQEPEQEEATGTPEPEAQQDAEISAIQQARDLVPVTARGVMPETLAQQVEYARAMVKAVNSLPTHFKNNIGDCLAVVDIASRCNLSPYMLANKTYVQNHRLCFESQAYHAMAQGSGLLAKPFEVKWKGQGDDQVCIITGWLRGDSEPRIYESPPLSQLHPGHTEKSVQNAEKKWEKKTFVRGSPLWDRKPKVQQFYDTIRDWIRIYCPLAMLGIMTRDELLDYADHMDAPKNGPGIIEKMQAATRTNAQKAEGHDPAKVTTDLGEIAEGAKVEILPAKTRARPGRFSPKRRQQAAAAAAPAAPKAKAKEEPKASTAAKPKAEPKKTEPAKPAAAPEPEKAKEPTNSSEYIAYASRWIGATSDLENVNARWEGEEDMRNDLRVSVTGRIALRKQIREKFGLSEE